MKINDPGTTLETNVAKVIKTNDLQLSLCETCTGIVSVTPLVKLTVLDCKLKASKNTWKVAIKMKRN